MRAAAGPDCRLANAYGPTEASIVTLVDQLNADAGFAKWDFVAPGEDILTDEGLGGGGLGTDAIAVGIISQPDRATPGSAQGYQKDRTTATTASTQAAQKAEKRVMGTPRQMTAEMAFDSLSTSSSSWSSSMMKGGASRM